MLIWVIGSEAYSSLLAAAAIFGWLSITAVFNAAPTGFILLILLLGSVIRKIEQQMIRTREPEEHVGSSCIGRK